MPDSSISSRIARSLTLRLLELTALSTTALAFVLTVVALETTSLEESNFVTDTLATHHGWTEVGLLAIGVWAGAFALFRAVDRRGYHRSALGGGLAIAALGVGDLAINVDRLAQVGWPASTPESVVGTAAPVVAGALLVAAHPYRDVVAGGVGRLQPVASRAAPAVVAVLMVTSTMGGLALVGTQPLTDGQSGTASAAEGDEIWSGSTGDGVYSSPTIVAGTVYVGSQDGSLYAFDAETGAQQWSADTGSMIIFSSPTVANGTVYVGAYNGKLYAFDADTGDQEWSSASLGNVIQYSSPTVSNGSVYIGSSDNNLYKINASNGNIEWSKDAGSQTQATPTVANETVYIGTLGGDLKAYDASSGSEKWTFSTGNDIQSAPTVDDGTVYVGSNDNNLYAIDANTGSKIWNQSTGGDITSSPTVAGGAVFVGSHDNNLYSFDADSGEKVWSASTGNTIRLSSPTVANGIVYIGSNDGSVYGFDAGAGTERWSYATGNGVESSPTVANGTLYVGSNDNNLYAIDTSHSKDSSGSRNRLHTLGHVGGVYQSTGGSTGAPDINGTVENQNDQPVPNATVTVTGVDREQLDVSPSELDSRAKEILDEAKNVKPPEWDPDRQLTGGSGLFGDANTTYVAANPKGDWGLTAFQDNPQLGNPRVQLPAGEEIALHVRDPTSGGLVQDGVDSDLPGTVVDDTDIVIKSIDHEGGTVDTQTVSTETTYDVAFGGSHDLATLTLPAGFYKVHPEGSPEAAYPIVVGNPDQIAETIRADLENEAGQLTEQAQEARDYLDQDVLRQYTTTTNADGEWSVDVPDSVTRVSVQAHKSPPGLDQEPQNASLQDVREFYKVTEYNGSYVMPADAGTYSAPANDITVDVVETEAPQFADLDKFKNATERFQNLLQNLSYSDLPAELQQRLDELDRADLEEMAEELGTLTNQNSQLEARVEELANRDIEDFDINDSSNAELREQIQAQQQAIAELRNTIESSDSTSELADGVAQTSATFGEELTAEQVRVVANFANGTSRQVPSEYISIDQSVATIVGQGGTQVSVEDYPVGDASGVSFNYQVVSANGVGETTTAATAPGADSIGLDAISLSSLRPGPDEQVDVTLIGDDETQLTEISDARVVGPSGSTLNATATDTDSVTFQTAGQGRHYLEVTFQTAAGSEGTLTHRIKAGPTDRAMPPGVRLKDTPFGTVAVVGDGFEAGSIETDQGGSQLDVTAQIGPNADAPASMHLYAHAVDMPPQATLSISIVRGDAQQNIQRNVEVTAHLPAMTAENAVLYRNSQALPREGEGRIADVSTTADETTITTVTDANGRVTIETNNNPGLLDRMSWYIDRNTPSLSIPFVGQSTPLMPDMIGALVWTPPTAPAAETAPTTDAAL